jgi:hypothetical protein
MSSIRAILTPQLRAAIKPRTFRLQQNPIRFQTAAMSAISDAITKDHRELRQYYNEVVNSSDPDHQQRFGNQFVWELARHSIGEELIVYPAMEKYMGDRGKKLADDDRQEHHEVHKSPPQPEIPLTSAGQGTSEGLPEPQLLGPRLRPQAEENLELARVAHRRGRKERSAGS